MFDIVIIVVVVGGGAVVATAFNHFAADRKYAAHLNV